MIRKTPVLVLPLLLFAMHLRAADSPAPPSGPALEQEVRALRERIAALEEILKKAGLLGEPGATLPPAAPAATPAGAKPAGTPEAKAAPPLPEQKKFQIGADIRARAEYRDPVDYRIPGTFGRPAAEAEDDDDDFVLLRTRLNATFQPAPSATVFVQVQDSRAWGEEGSVLKDLEKTDLHQGWMEVRRGERNKVRFRVGRQELSYGDQRLVSPLDWSNVGRAWDAGVFSWSRDIHSLDVFYSNIKEGTTTDEDQTFSGAWWASAWKNGIRLEPYAFWRQAHDGSALSEGGVAGDLEDYTYGLLVKDTKGSWLWSAEIVRQDGERSEDDVQAWAAALTGSYTWKDAKWKPRLNLEYTFAQGDPKPGDGNYETFDPLFPFGHNYQGFQDLVGWRNSHDAHIGGAFQPAERTRFAVDLHAFWLDETEDGWYDASGRIVRRDPTGEASSELGQEIDLTVWHKLIEGLELQAGYSIFFPGSYVEGTGFDSSQDWFYILLRSRF